MNNDLELKALYALRDLYKAHIAEADYNITNYLKNPTAIGEHPDLLIEMDKFMDMKANAIDKLAIVDSYLDPLEDEEYEYVETTD